MIFFFVYEKWDFYRIFSARQVKLWTPLGGIYHTQYVISILNWSQLISTDHNRSQLIITISLVAHKQYSNTLTERREPKFQSRTLGGRRETKVNTSIRLGHHLGRGSESQVWGLEEPSAIYNHEDEVWFYNFSLLYSQSFTANNLQFAVSSYIARAVSITLQRSHLIKTGVRLILKECPRNLW